MLYCVNVSKSKLILLNKTKISLIKCSFLRFITIKINSQRDFEYLKYSNYDRIGNLFFMKMMILIVFMNK